MQAESEMSSQLTSGLLMASACAIPNSDKCQWYRHRVAATLHDSTLTIHCDTPTQIIMECFCLIEKFCGYCS